MFDYNWSLKDYPKKGKYAVFGAFLCGGGSTMGYKLAGYNHIGGIELDPKIAAVYKKNHKPKYLYNEDIRAFNKRKDLPEELFDLDILDGSPPCTTFSTAGNREKTWGKEKKFAEGQKLQRLDDLVFVYCDTIKKLKPKVCILENVSGIIKGNAKWYSKKIIEYLEKAGYKVQVFLLDAATMGVPQKRQRVFFIGRKKELNWTDLKLNFNEKPVYFSEIMDREDTNRDLSDYYYSLWEQRKPSDSCYADIVKRVEKKYKLFSHQIIKSNKVANTLTSNLRDLILYDIPRSPNQKELLKISAFPYDYDFCGQNLTFIMGMSIPPVMMARISEQIRLQWLDKKPKIGEETAKSE